jgi:hypothetical protein
MIMPGLRATSVSTSTLVYTGECYLHEIYVQAGDDNAHVGLANAVATGGTRVVGLRALATSQMVRSFPGRGIYFGTGLFATTTGTAPIIEIVYSIA